ncbi:MAG: SPFH domain-containing protein [Candidatus Diapherotrites archaeon]
MSKSQTKKGIFLIILLILIAFILLLVLFRDQLTENWVWVLLILIVLAVIIKFPFIIFLKDYERAVIFRFGKVRRVGGPGWAFLIPMIEDFTKVDLRVKTIDVAKQDVVTKDNIELRVDAVIYLKVKKDKDAVINSVVEVENYVSATELYVIATVRNIIGSMTLSEAISNIDELNNKLITALEKVSKNWGIAIEAAEIKDLDIPEAVLTAMHEEKAALSRMTARLHLAEATKAEINAVKEAAEHLSDKAVAYYYIEALKKLGDSPSTKFIFPMELTNLASLVGGGKTAISQTELDSAFEKYAPLIEKLTGKKLKKK